MGFIYLVFDKKLFMLCEEIIDHIVQAMRFLLLNYFYGIIVADYPASKNVRPHVR